MKRQSVAKPASVCPRTQEARSSSVRRSVSFAQALSEASCSELFSIICCCLCVTFTFTCAFFMPEISVIISDRIMPDGLARSDDGPQSRHGGVTPKNRRDTAYAWRNDTDRACAQSCLQGGAGGIFLQPFSHSYDAVGSSNAFDGRWPLEAIVQTEICGGSPGDPSSGSDERKKKRSVFANAPYVPFDARLLDQEGLVLIGEMRHPEISDRAAAAAVQRRNRASGKGTLKLPASATPEQARLLKNAVTEDSTNVNARVLANVPRGYNADRTTAAVRRAKRVLSSFDLVLLGAWEIDPVQRRALLNVLRGVDAVATMTDAQVASALQLPNESIPFEAPTEEQIAAAALPFQKRARANATTSSSSSGGDSAGDARRMRQMREQTDVDIRLFHHATAMSTAAFRAPSLSPGMCNKGAADELKCALSASANKDTKYLADRHVCGEALTKTAMPMASKTTSEE